MRKVLFVIASCVDAALGSFPRSSDTNFIQLPDFGSPDSLRIVEEYLKDWYFKNEHVPIDLLGDISELIVTCELATTLALTYHAPKEMILFLAELTTVVAEMKKESIPLDSFESFKESLGLDMADMTEENNKNHLGPFTPSRRVTVEALKNTWNSLARSSYRGMVFDPALLKACDII